MSSIRPREESFWSRNVSQKMLKFLKKMRKLTSFEKLAQINPGKFLFVKIEISMKFWHILNKNGAKHSPLPLSLEWPSAGFGGPRAGAWFWPFDPRLVIEIVHISTNSPTIIQRTLRALSWLNMSSIRPQEESARSRNVSQKTSKFSEKYENWHFSRN